MLSPRLSRIVLMVRGSEGVALATNFYHQALGLAVRRVTDEWAELTLHSDVTLHVQSTYAEGQLSTGYSPVLTFEVADMDQTIAACAQAGGGCSRVSACCLAQFVSTHIVFLFCTAAHMDGPIQYPAYGKVAALRAPDGHMLGLFEPSS